MTKKYAKVEGHPNLVRDLETNAILNTDKQSLLNYTNNRKKINEDKIKIEKIESDMKDLKNSIEEIKTLLRDVINGS